MILELSEKEREFLLELMQIRVNYCEAFRRGSVYCDMAYEPQIYSLYKKLTDLGKHEVN